MARPLRAIPPRAALLGETEGLNVKDGSPVGIALGGVRCAHTKNVGCALRTNAMPAEGYGARCAPYGKRSGFDFGFVF